MIHFTLPLDANKLRSQEAPMRRLFLITAAAFLLSMVGKWMGDAFLHERIALISSFLGLQPSQNQGVAFGISLPFQSLLVLVAILTVFIFAVRTARSSLSLFGFGLILGGALGNIADRLLDGLVTDFIQVGTFPIFNVADSCITIGVCLLLWETVRKR